LLWKNEPVTGHLFIVNGDLTKIACDAILIPTDPGFNIEPPWQDLLAGRVLPKRWDSTSLAPLDRAGTEPRIWLGNVGLPGNTWKFDRFKPAVRRFVEKASAAARLVDNTARIYPWPKPRLAVNVIGSGQGGGFGRKGELVRGLIETLQELADAHDIDIALVTFGEKPYAAAQRVRRDLLTGTDLTTTWRFGAHASKNLLSEGRRLADAAIDSQLVLFIGAGVSAGAGVPMWKALLADLAKDAGMPREIIELLKDKDARDQATLIERRLHAGDSDLRERVVSALEPFERYSLQHALLASLPSKEAITTNFDKLFEIASRIERRRLAVLPDDPSKSRGRWLLKLHGSVDDPEKIVLTRSDYLEMPRRYGALIGLVQGLLLMRHMMFVGYSLQDEDFHELIHEVRSARGDAAGPARGTALTLFDDGLERELWEEDLHIVPMTTLPPTSEDIPEAARELEIFLDLVGFLSATSAAFFLDPTYRALSDDEASLREALMKLVEETHGSGRHTVGNKVRRFLKELGSTEN
jgi:hypothetical protein